MCRFFANFATSKREVGVMNRFFATYGNSFISYADAWESLFATLTPCKNINNQTINHSNTVNCHI